MTKKKNTVPRSNTNGDLQADIDLALILPPSGQMGNVPSVALVALYFPSASCGLRAFITTHYVTCTQLGCFMSENQSHSGRFISYKSKVWKSNRKNHFFSD